MKVRKQPRYVSLDKCISCGACAEKCPSPVIDDYNAGMGKRKAIYKYYAQAIPSAYGIDAKSCRQLGQGKRCGVCAKVCPADAIDYEQKEETVDLEVGAIIVSNGFKAFDPSRFDTYNYADHPNVVTALEFERLLSAGGPTRGHLVRPSELHRDARIELTEKELKKLEKQAKPEDAERIEELRAEIAGMQKLQTHEHPKRIAWLQCVGSRDTSHCNNGYCSGVCCMYAIKEAVIAKEHAKGDLDAAIFFMDMRTFGKEFEQYYTRAKNNGIRFLRSRVHTCDPIPGSDNLQLNYVSESGEIMAEEFDMVVLSVGLESSPDANGLAEKIGFDLDHYRFAKTSSFTPVATIKARDLRLRRSAGSQGHTPFGYGSLGCRWALPRANFPGPGTRSFGEKVFPQERDVSSEPPRIGVFVCNCGINIASVVRVPEVVEYAKYASQCRLRPGKPLLLFSGCPGQACAGHKGAKPQPRCRCRLFAANA